MQICELDGQVTLFDPDLCSGKTCQEPSVQENPKVKTSVSSSKRSAELKAIPYMFLDLAGPGDLLGLLYWETLFPWCGDALMLNTGVSPREEKGSSLSPILEDSPPRKYYLSPKACLGILRRAWERGKELPYQLRIALMAQAGLCFAPTVKDGVKAFHINQRDEGIDLGEVSGALMATNNLQMQTFVSPECLTPWDTQQKRIFLPDGVAPTLAGADGGGGRNPGGLLLAAFSAGAGSKAGGIGYSEEVAPTLKGSASGNCMPSLLCLNDQGGDRMDLTVDQTMTLRAGMGSHQPLVCLNDQGGQVMECTEDMTGTLRAQEHGHQPIIFENHGIDARYTGPHQVVPTISARAGTGGNNLPLVTAEETADSLQVFSRQRVDIFAPGEVVSTESARQHKDATDLIYQETVGTLTCGDSHGPNIQYVSQDKLIVETPLLIRRLTPLECERLQGFPDGWTDIPGASDSARYKALGNSVAIPCVEFIMSGIALALRADV